MFGHEGERNRLQLLTAVIIPSGVKEPKNLYQQKNKFFTGTKVL